MEIEFFSRRWGPKYMDWVKFAQTVKSDGCTGLEVFPPASPSQNENMVSAYQGTWLNNILRQAERTENGRIADRYIAAMERHLYALLGYQKNQIKPQYSIPQAGREYYSTEQMRPCFDLCDRRAREIIR